MNWRIDGKHFGIFNQKIENGNNNGQISEAHRAMELLEEYHASLGHTDSDLRRELERIITVFKRELFQSLLGEYSGILTFSGGKVSVFGFIPREGHSIDLNRR